MKSVGNCYKVPENNFTIFQTTSEDNGFKLAIVSEDEDLLTVGFIDMINDTTPGRNPTIGYFIRDKEEYNIVAISPELDEFCRNYELPK